MSIDNNEKFYKKLDEFKQTIEKLLISYDKYDEAEELNVYYDQLLFLKKANMFTPIDLFYTNGVLKYITEIIEKDEKFFMNKINDIEQQNQDKMTIIEHIKSVWFLLSNENKNNIWNYIRIICFYAERSYIDLNGGIKIFELSVKNHNRL